MSILLDPDTQLGFNRPLTQLVKKSLTVRNPHAQPVAFKVKTTAPKLYCVRPNSGRIEPGQYVDVQVLLQPMKEDPPASAKCKDKFLVQSTFITPEKEGLSLADLWNGVEGEVHQQKIKVVYLPTEGQAIPEEPEAPSQLSHTNDSRFTAARDLAGSSMMGSFVPVHHEQAPIGRASPAHGEPGEYIIAHEETSHNETTYGDARPPPSPKVHNHIPPISEEEEERASSDARPSTPLTAKFSAAQEEILRLRAQIASMSNVANGDGEVTGLRKRTKAATEVDGESLAGDRSFDGASSYLAGPAPTEQVDQGVPIQMVAIIALVVFVTTYLFF